MKSSRYRPARRALPLVSAALAVTLTAAACSSSDSSNSSGGGSTDITVVHANSIDTIDPIQAEQAETDTVANVVYDPAVTYDSNNNIVGVLADKFTVAPDAKSVSITMKSGPTFHDGTSVTATDVKYTLDRDVAVGTGVASYLSDYASSTVDSPTTLTITLKDANAFFLGMLSKIYILNSKVVQAHAGTDHGQAWLQSHDAGSGPFTVGEQKSLNDITVNRYDKYWNYDKTRPTSMRILRVDQSATQAADLRAGTADVALKLSSADALAIGDTGNLKTAWINSGLSEYIFFNTNTGPTANPIVRQALQYAYDYEGGLEKVWNGKGALLDGPLPPTLSCEPKLGGYKQDLDKAKALLAGAGVSNLHLTMRYQPALAEFTQEATLFQSNLKQIGVTLDLVPITFSDYLASLSDTSKIPQVMLLGDVPRFPDTGIYLNYVYNSKSVGTNYSGFSNPQVDALLDKAKVTSDPAARCPLYEQAQKIIYDQAVAVNMYTYQQPVSHRADITGVVASPNANPITLSTLRIS
ncbi:peptide/nickel transport system substrate-binding protein [Jatrophihabitans sp. GAS493]|uniref:ABC transporter substrate-binding protein n=1 Tax=Jatrophihabitans sp. GAS493 TaxID=1907575 RepID=UPI000BC0ADC2|nr:ABC transporter substrate-binding protein [Jatrophihabitans sp. GAS493]SOD72602.1 peptide/nickel transport system substrate-binding protein [Jatrophihabitans sp. GAS493]